MTDPDLKLVKVDNWGIYFLQRLKHFFNRTDYCDLTLQFQDNAQLKVHRLVLSACTEYFELLERTCEMYEDCLVMPDDLQADVVVPIVNFMYTGQLEFKMDLLERLYQTSQIMNLPVLTKLLDAHRSQAVITPLKQVSASPSLNSNYSSVKRSYSKRQEKSKSITNATPTLSSNKRSYSKAFGAITPVQKENKRTAIVQTSEVSNNVLASSFSNRIDQISTQLSARKVTLTDPRPTRYELPEELDTDNIFDNSFTNISYTSQPLMVHPETTKQSKPKRSGIFNEPSGSRRNMEGTSIVDIVECKKVMKNDHIFDDDSEIGDEHDNMYLTKESHKVSNQLFDQIIDENESPKVVIETKDNKQANNIDHAKIISEVLKKYPHLVKSNKNIKLKILNTPSTPVNKPKSKKRRNSPPVYEEKIKMDPDCSYETEVLDSKEAARLISLGAENVAGPWICLICGTPGKALHFTSYYKFRRHLVEIHKEKPVSNMCEYCGLKSTKRNYLLHHLLTKHGVEPPPSHQFPKCNLCNYIALTESFLVKHKLAHQENKNFRCNVCASTFSTSSDLLSHIQRTGHKYSAERKANLQCVYCQKVFLREGNLYAHLKTYHKASAKNDLIIDDSDEERQEEPQRPIIKNEPNAVKTEYDEYVDQTVQYQIRPDGNIEVITTRKPQIATPTTSKQKILNTGFGPVSLEPKSSPYKKPAKNLNTVQDGFNEDIVMIDNNEYIMRDNQLIPRQESNDYIISDLPSHGTNQRLTASTSLDYSHLQNTISQESLQDEKLLIKKSSDINQPIQIVVSNEEEYKALMNSNHSIIFDDGDANKTLTVLSAPHAATLNTTAIDLDNNQSNDMMIIQDNYPMNVSEALPSNNSNIVVVYSHNVGDEQNKQFQLITSQDIGAQFVQSSAVLTQNFETITTSSPQVMNAQVIDTQVAQQWQNEVQENQCIQMASTGNNQMHDLHDMAIIEHSDISAVDPSANHAIEELPEVTLSTTDEPSTLHIHETEENIESQHLSEENMEEIESPTVESQNSPTNPIDENMSSEANHTYPASTPLSNDNIENVIQEVESNESLPQDSSNNGVEIVVSEEQQLEKPTAETTEENEQVVLEAMETEDVTDPEEASEMVSDVGDKNVILGNIPNENDQNEEDSVESEQVVTETTLENTEKNPVEIKEQIQSLASEWSEDEDDTEGNEQHNPNQQVQTIEEGTEKDIQENNITTEPEIEESIENIQQEVDKEIEDSEETNVKDGNVIDDLNGVKQPVTPVVEAPQENISSLLNDWDENDSQEGNDSVNGAEDSEEPTLTTAENVKSVAKDNEIIESKKVDKIQSLVNDWDEDEENGKN